MYLPTNNENMLNYACIDLVIEHICPVKCFGTAYEISIVDWTIKLK